MVKSHLILTMAAVLLSASALAQNEGGRSMDSAFDSLDTNKDARIDRNEAQQSAVVTQSFATADANGDGAITREEFNASFTMRPSGSTPPAAPLPPASPPPR